MRSRGDGDFRSEGIIEMRTLDGFLAWVLVVAGAGNLLSRWVPALHWFGPVLLAGSGFAVLLLGFLNVARTRGRSDAVVHWAAVIANALALVYAVRVLLAFGTLSLRAPIPLALAVVVAVQAVLSVRK